MFTAIGLGVGLWANKTVKRRGAERDYFYHQYMSSHPEDFPLIGELHILRKYAGNGPYFTIFSKVSIGDIRCFMSQHMRPVVYCILLPLYTSQSFGNLLFSVILNNNFMLLFCSIFYRTQEIQGCIWCLAASALNGVGISLS